MFYNSILFPSSDITETIKSSNIGDLFVLNINNHHVIAILCKLDLENDIYKFMFDGRINVAPLVIGEDNAHFFVIRKIESSERRRLLEKIRIAYLNSDTRLSFTQFKAAAYMGRVFHNEFNKYSSVEVCMMNFNVPLSLKDDFIKAWNFPYCE